MTSSTLRSGVASGTSALPLGVRQDASLNRDQLAMFARIEAADFPFVGERLVTEGKIAAEDLPAAVMEFKRYFALQSIAGDVSLGMVSKIVDEVWHQFILFTRAYTEFCSRSAGHYIHHLPKTSLTPIPTNAGRNLIDWYEQYFGEMPELWFRDQPRDEIVSGTCSTSTASTGSGGTCSGSTSS